MIRYLFFTVCAFFLTITSVVAQKTDPSWKGIISGTVWDREHTSVLRASTVAVYFFENNELIGYRLTDNYGEFSYSGLPLNVKLRLVASFIGHASAEHSFTLKSADKLVDLGKFDLPFSTTDLDEVKISATPPPIRMKGDTLEFYADAYKLRPTAQTEDLLRALPGVTIWADGSITVNGREVKGVLVNGKPFFGNDARIATQNIPKDAVEKIQVYKKNKGTEKLTDSTTEMNIQLKKGKNIGFFGKISGGIGTSERYDGDATINLFNSRSQLGAAFAQNNVNKVAGNLDFILRNSTYKGPGANVEYQSDFTKEGTNDNKAGGLQFQHDFIDKPDFYNNNRLNGTYFISDNHSDINRETLSLITLGNSAYFRQSDAQSNISNIKGHRISSDYDWNKDGKRLTVATSFSSNLRDYSNSSSSVMDFKEDIPISENQITDKGNSRHQQFDVTVSYKGDSKGNKQYWYSAYNLDYSFKIEDRTNLQELRSDFRSFMQSARNISFDRRYDNKTTGTINSANIYLPNFAKLIFGESLPLGIRTALGTRAKLSDIDFRAIAQDRDTTSGLYMTSQYLTNNRNEKTLEILPYFNFSKNIYRLLSNRYEKNFTAAITTELEFNGLASKSEKSFQQFDRNYLNFNPKLDVSYSNKTFGEYIRTLSFSVAYINKYPTVQQLAPVVDSINTNIIQIGNPNLKQQRTGEMKIGYSSSSEDPNKITTWSIILSAGYAARYFTGNNQFDDLGRLIYSTINSDGYRFVRTNLNYKKAFRFADHQVQFSLTPNLSFEQTPTIINGSRYTYDNMGLVYDPKISYSWKDRLTVNISQRGTHNSSREKGNSENRLTSSVSQSELSLSLNIVEGLNLSSNLFYTRNQYNGKLFNEFTIWNASAGYRFLKARTAEIKISGLDLLGQNKGVISFGSNNTITQGTINALQRYLMVSLSYYPRKFGK